MVKINNDTYQQKINEFLTTNQFHTFHKVEITYKPTNDSTSVTA
jgi:hypothetical protein